MIRLLNLLKKNFRFYDRGDNIYSTYGTADWENGVYSGIDGYNEPSVGDDFFALTWGGDGEFKASEKDIYGNYQYDQVPISFSLSDSDGYAGYAWSFKEEKDGILIDYAADSIN